MVLRLGFDTAYTAMVRKRKIIAYIADGFVARPDGSVDWLDRPRPKDNYGVGVFDKSIDTILWGRKTYEMALDCQQKGVAAMVQVWIPGEKGPLTPRDGG